MALPEPLISMDSFDFESKKVLLRLDLDVDLKSDPEDLAAKRRLSASLKTLRELHEQNARIIICGHWGETIAADAPSAKKKKRDDSSARSLADIGEFLAAQLDCEILLPDSCLGEAAKKVIHDARGKQIILLENLALHPGETADGDAFARELLNHADVFISDSFATLHENRASTSILPKLFADRLVGRSLENALESLGTFDRAGNRDAAALVGGAQVADSLELLDILIGRVGRIAIAGDLGLCMLEARGNVLGSPSEDAAAHPLYRGYLSRLENSGAMVLLPVDAEVVSASGEPLGSFAVDAIPSGARVVNVGPRTVEYFAKELGLKRCLLVAGSLEGHARRTTMTRTEEFLKAIEGGSLEIIVAAGQQTDALIAALPHKSRAKQVFGWKAAREWLRRGRLPGLEALG